MADSLTPEQRSWNMSRIRSRDTKPEKIVRSLLHRMGYRFRLDSRTKLPAPEPGARALSIRPDIVLPKYRTVLFVHGCFWHRHPGCQFAYTPKSRLDFWERKFAENIARDHRNETALRAAGWNVVVVWECELRDAKPLAERLRREVRRVVRYEPGQMDREPLPAAAEPPAEYRAAGP